MNSVMNRLEEARFLGNHGFLYLREIDPQHEP